MHSLTGFSIIDWINVSFFCRTSGTLVKEKRVAAALREIEPEAVRRRDPSSKKRKQTGNYYVPGPLYIISADGHDKLTGQHGNTFPLHIYG